uniref:Ig-like domain-containing protein n=1 Tax=Mesocestoides corti TaxID=53468 RepID=A0A5K3ERI1_MESCO
MWRSTLLLIIPFALFKPLQAVFPPPPLTISLSSDRVALGDSVTIRCHVNPISDEGALMARSSMALYCPVVQESAFCFQNCRPLEQCDSVRGGDCKVIPALEKVACRSITQASGEIIYEYTIDHVTQEWFDKRQKGFACYSAAQTTDWVRLLQAPGKESFQAKTTTTTRIPSTTKSTTTTTTTTSTTMASTTTSTAAPKSVIISETNSMESGVNWFNFLRNSANSWGFWTPEMITIIALSALALSVLINCFCCVKWFVRRHHRKPRNLKRSDTFGTQQDFKTRGVPAVAWFPADPRYVPHGVPTAQQMTPSSAYHRQTAILDGSVSENPPSWGLYDGGNAARAHPEGKAANGSTMSNSGGRNSDSGFSLAHAAPVHLITSAGYPMSFDPLGWSGPVTPRSKQHRLRHSLVPPYYIGMKRAPSRETVFSERPMSELGFESNHYIPVVLGGSCGVRASQPHLGAYGPPLCGPDVSLIEKPGAGDGASAGGGSGSPKPGMAVLLPAAVIGHQFGVLPPPSSSTERSSAPLLKTDLTLKAKTAPQATLEEAAAVNDSSGQNAAEVQKWLQSMSSAEKELPTRHHLRLPTKLADSLNTEYDVASDWSEREPILMQEKPDSEGTVPTD